MDKIALVLMLAVTAEALVEYGKSLAAAFGGGDYKAAVLQLCAAVVGVLLCVLSGAGHVRGARRAVQLAGGGHGAHRDFCEPRREFRQ